MDAAMIIEVAMMDVPVEVGFDMRMGDEHFPESVRIFQATRKMGRITTQTRIVVGKNERGFVGVIVQGLVQPFKLGIAQKALGDHGGFERIEQKQVGLSGLDDADVLRRYSGDVWWKTTLQGASQNGAIIVIAQSEVHGKSGFR